VTNSNTTGAAGRDRLADRTDRSPRRDLAASGGYHRHAQLQRRSAEWLRQWRLLSGCLWDTR